MTENESLCLLGIDGLNILRRCYEANPAPDSLEKAQGACKSAFASFKRALNEHQPSHVIAAFDHGGQTWRHQLYSDYRKSRTPMPQVLRDEIPGFMERLTRELGILTVCIPGVEADDVLATVVMRWVQQKGAKVIVVSTDKDLCQLIAHGVLLRDHFKPEWRDEAWVQNKFGVSSAQLGDWLALVGDKSDDIPGVDKVGDKTATRLLLEHGSLNAILEAAPGIPGKLGERLCLCAEDALLSQQLVTLKLDVTVGVCWRQLELHVPVAG